MVICWRVCSHNNRAPLTWTFNERITPNWGISTQTSTTGISSTGIPSFSCPRTITTLRGKLYDERHILLDVCSAAITVYPSFFLAFNQVASSTGHTANIGIHCSDVRLRLRNSLVAVMFISLTTNACALKTSQVRLRPPILTGFPISVVTRITCKKNRIWVLTSPHYRKKIAQTEDHSFREWPEEIIYCTDSRRYFTCWDEEGSSK